MLKIYIVYKINKIKANDFNKVIKEPYYYILILSGEIIFSINFVQHNANGKIVIFLYPNQVFTLIKTTSTSIDTVCFKDNFYDLQYPKKGLDINNFRFKQNYFNPPFKIIEKEEFKEIYHIIDKMKLYENRSNIFVFQAYLQLIIVLTFKNSDYSNTPFLYRTTFENTKEFYNVLEEYFIKERAVCFYASIFGMSVDSFSKKVKRHLGKSPRKIIQERVVLEARKMLHLTYKSIKEIAGDLNFEDELYFSRYFKREEGISPKNYRYKMGVADTK